MICQFRSMPSPLGNLRPDELMLLCVLGVTDAGGQDGFQTGRTAFLMCSICGSAPNRGAAHLATVSGLMPWRAGVGAAVKNLLHRSSLGRS